MATVLENKTCDVEFPQPNKGTEKTSWVLAQKPVLTRFKLSYGLIILLNLMKAKLLM